MMTARPAAEPLDRPTRGPLSLYYSALGFGRQGPAVGGEYCVHRPLRLKYYAGAECEGVQPDLDFRID